MPVGPDILAQKGLRGGGAIRSKGDEAVLSEDRGLIGKETL